MQKRAGTWDLEQAAWLHQYEQGNACLVPLVVAWHKDRNACLLTTLGTTPTAPRNDAPPEHATDEAPEEIDVAGWPAIVPHLYA